MTRFYVTLMFSFVSLAGLVLVLHAILANRKPAVTEDAPLGFSDEQDSGILDLETGHEGLKHRDKEPFNPDKHKPEPL
jgi:hypothetical protein